jgi:hypothetical protein
MDIYRHLTIILWGMTPCSLREVNCLHVQGRTVSLFVSCCFFSWPKHGSSTFLQKCIHFNRLHGVICQKLFIAVTAVRIANATFACLVTFLYLRVQRAPLVFQPLIVQVPTRTEGGWLHFIKYSCSLKLLAFWILLVSLLARSAACCGTTLRLPNLLRTRAWREDTRQPWKVPYDLCFTCISCFKHEGYAIARIGPWWSSSWKH